MDKKDKIFKLDKKEICITSAQIKQAIDLLVDENELLQDRLYKQQDEIERLNNIIIKLKKDLIKEIDSLQDIKVESKEYIRCRTLCGVLDKLSDLIGELKEGK